VNLHHRLDGPADAPVLVLSSSLGTTLDLWEPNIAAWTGSFRVLRYDHRGHGRSLVTAGPYSVELLADDVLALLDALGCERVSLCGISLGGAVGISLAATAPERVDRLVLACTSARFGDPAVWLERAAAVRSDGIRAIADTVVGRWFTAAFAARRPDLVDRFRAMLLATPADGYAACCEALAAWDFRDRLGAVAADTLVVAGADDPATPPEHAQLIANAIPTARLVVLPQAAHLANVEHPERFGRLVGDHVGAHVEAAR
jgi:3-oxoadipate enol-lactonase